MTNARKVCTRAFLLSSALLTPLALAATPARAAVQGQPAAVSFNIPAQDLGSALTEFARQSRQQLLYSPELVRGKRSTAVVGRFSAEAGLRQLLSNSEISLSTTSSGAFLLSALGNGASAANGRSDLVEAGRPVADSGDPVSGDQVDQEIVVTGSNIRGIAPAGQKLIVLDRKEIERSGYSSVQEVIRSLPQNFRGNARRDTINTGNASALQRDVNNSAFGDGINLRGLGPDSTLTLINGRRLAPSGLNAAFSDVSIIPVGALERIEILPDGASALYGADAVGGVVNFILRKNFDGAESHFRYAHLTDGPYREVQFSQVLGRSWMGGSALVSFDFLNNSELPSVERYRTTGDHRGFGGVDNRSTICNPGTLQVGGVTYGIPAGQNGTSLESSDLVPGTNNRCSNLAQIPLQPEAQQWSIFGRFRQELSPSVSLFFDTLFGYRKSSLDSPQALVLTVPSTNPFYVNPTGGTEPVTVRYDLTPELGPMRSEVTARTLNAALGAEVKFGGDWSMTAYTGPTRQRETQSRALPPDPMILADVLADARPDVALNPFGQGSNTNSATITRLRDSQRFEGGLLTKLWLNNVVLNGPVLGLPGGDLKVAFGADYRSLRTRARFNSIYRERGTKSPLNKDFDRDVIAGFAELFIPIFDTPNAVRGVRQLTLSLAGRYERYNDFGSNFSPRLGALYSPIRGLRIRASWAKSFKAPGLADLSTNQNSNLITTVSDPQSPTGTSPALFLGGGNPDLKPETARTWSFGFDTDKKVVDGASLSATYFHIEFKGLIGLPPMPGLFAANGPTVIRDPSQEVRAAACASAPFLGNYSMQPGDCLTAPISGILDFRPHNLAGVSERGIDILFDYTKKTSFGDLNASLNATYLLQYTVQVTETSEPIKALNTIGDPLRFKARTSFGWRNAGWAIQTYLNFANSYKDDLSTPKRRIKPWTTIDINLSYDLSRTGWNTLDDTLISLNVRNIFDERAPFAAGAFNFVGYDSANADLIGRLVAISLRKNW